MNVSPYFKSDTKRSTYLSFRCAEQHRNYIKCKEEIMQSVKSTANRLLQLITQKVTCLTDCTDQEANLRVSINLL